MTLLPFIYIYTLYYSQNWWKHMFSFIQIKHHILKRNVVIFIQQEMLVKKNSSENIVEMGH